MRLYISACVIFLLSYFGITKVIQLNFYNSFSPAILFLRESSLNLKDFIILLGNVDEIRKENTQLKILLSGMETKFAQYQIDSTVQQEKNILEKEFNTTEVLKNRKILIKKIIRYDPFSSRLILDNSVGDIVKNNSLVIIGANFIGTVVDNRNSIIEVKLLSDRDLIINTHIINQNNFKIKTVLDSESGDSLVINNVLATEDVKAGDLVITSNINEFIIPNLIVGKIQRIEGISSQTFRKAYIQKNYDLNLRNYVGILNYE